LKEARDENKWLTGKLIIDFLSSRPETQAGIEHFTEINGTHYQIADALNQRFRDLKYPIYASARPKYILFTLIKPTVRRILKTPTSSPEDKQRREEKRLSEEKRLRTCLLDKHPDNEYIAFFHQVIAAKREELKNINDERIKGRGKDIKIEDAPTEAYKEKRAQKIRNVVDLITEG